MKKTKKKAHFKFTYRLSVFIFLTFNIINALTVINLIPEGTSFTSNLEELNQSPPETDNFNQDLIPGSLQPVFNTFLNQFTPQLSTQTETPTSNSSITSIDNQPPSSPSFNTNIPTSSSSGSSGSSSGESGSSSSNVDCTDKLVVNQTININCYKGNRTYNTNIVTLENSNSTSSCNLNLAIDTSSGSGVSNNFTAGNADIFFTLSSVPDSLIDLEQLPAPEQIGTWSQWENNPLQVELIGPTTNTPINNQTYSIPPSTSRNLGMIIDCGVDTITSETATIKLKSTFEN